ncbi:alpha/beta hydrolase [Sporobolomyces salmoneus]|uniref:alpha/beta hydrolase n=1 Tax=Sporobolomyces salmoneus TaxID=183962 RepID=UPI003178DA18
MAVWPLSWLLTSSVSETSPSASPKLDPPNSAASKKKQNPDLVTVKEGGGGATDSKQSSSTTTTLEQVTTLLEPFKATGKLPEKARTDPSVQMRDLSDQGLSLSRLFEFVPFFVSNGTSLTKAFVQHHLYGPPKPSWGVELTLFTTFLREVSNYSHLSSLARLRAVVELGSLLPMPKDGIVTPISFKVKKRQLRGFLAGADSKENGKREITGEWVTNKRLWRKMTREWSKSKEEKSTQEEKMASTTGKNEGGGNEGMVVLYLHGGAYYMFSVETHRVLTIAVSRYCEARVFAINYRLAPETQFPGQLHDAVSSYLRLTEDLKIPPENIIFAGDSAGGGLVLATLMYLRDEGYPLPSGAILMSPWVDLTMSCESWTTNRPYDYLPNPRAEDDHFHPVKCLLGNSISDYLTHPYVSPLFGDFTGLPPLLIQAGDAEVLRDEITLLAHKASLAGVKVEHEIFEDCVHVFQAFTFLEASRKSFQSQRTFVKHTLPRLLRSARAVTPQASFNLSQVDQEITKDAHEVDERGKAEEESLPPTPHMGEKDLEEDGVTKETGDARRRRDSWSSEDDNERLSDSTASPDRTPPFVATDSTQEPPSPTRTVMPEPSFSSLTPASSFLFGGNTESPSPSSSAVSSPPSTQSHRTDRPILRAYASARDLCMSKRDRTNSTTSFSPLLPTSSSSSTSAPTSPQTKTKSPRARGATIALSPRQADKSIALIHSRSSSHPDFKALLAEYERNGSRANTRLWGAEKSGRATPEELRESGGGGEKEKGPNNMYRRCSVDDNRRRRKESVDPSEAVEGIDVV